MSEPIFKRIFGDDWNNLPIVFKKHYSNLAYSDDVVTAEGIMDIKVSFLWRIFSPVSKLLGLLVPYGGKNIPVTVKFRSNPLNNHFAFDRVFYFPDKEPIRFYSVLQPVGGDKAVEVMSLGLGWNCRFSYENGNVLLAHNGYSIKIFGKLIPLPIGFLVGKGYAEETPIDNNRFSMKMELRHPFWGKIMGYSGIFTILGSENDSV